MIIMLDFTHTLNDSWASGESPHVAQRTTSIPADAPCLLQTLVHCLAISAPSMSAEDEDRRYLYLLLGTTAACYVGVIVLASFMFAWFVPSGTACGLNLALLLVSLLAICGFSSLR